MSKNVTSNGKYDEHKVYLVVTTKYTHTWYGGPAKKEIKYTIRKTLRGMAWNDYACPMVIKIPRFFAEKAVEVEIPPLSEGDVIVDILKDEN